MEEKNEDNIGILFRSGLNVVNKRIDDLVDRVETISDKLTDLEADINLIKDALIKLLGKIDMRSVSKSSGGWSKEAKDNVISRLERLISIAGQSDQQILQSFLKFLKERGFLTKKQMGLLRRIENRVGKNGQKGTDE